MSNNSVPAINYTARDFLIIKDALKNHLKVKFPTTWKDMTESQMGIALLDLVAYCFDNLSFALDYTANELYLDTARDRRSLLLLGRLVGYQLRTATSASVVCVATLPGSITNPVNIPSGTSVTTVDGIPFVTTQETVLQPSVEGAITFVQGVNRSDTVSSDASIFQKFVLTQYSVIEDTVTLTVDGDDWTEVGSLAYADSDSLSFAVEYDENGVATVVFGDGTTGKVPPLGAVIEVAYRTGGGIQGNIALSKIKTNVVGIEQTTGYPTVTVAVENRDERGSGGEEAETVSHAKLWIPHWVNANGRAVTEDDYDVLANAFSDPTYGAPAFAKAYLKQTIPELNTVELAVWSRDNTGVIIEPSIGLKNALSTYFNNDGEGAVKMLCQHCEVIDGNILYIDITAKISVATDYVSSDVATAVQTAIDNLFASSDVVPGADFRISILYQTIVGVAGVQYCIVEEIKGSYKTSETIAIADGISQIFSGTVTLDSGLTIVPGSASVYYGGPATETLTDDGEGNLLDSIGDVKGTIDYETGIITNAEFAAIPAVDLLIKCEYRYILDYQRGELEDTGDGTTTRFKGVVDFPPINPFDPVHGMKGIAFAAGAQVITDDGDGHLVGDIDPTGHNVIDYDTGGYDMTFALAPANGQEIDSTYKQILKTPSQDIPVDKSQMAIRAIVTITMI